jgi:hypothetical protein
MRRTSPGKHPRVTALGALLLAICVAGEASAQDPTMTSTVEGVTITFTLPSGDRNTEQRRRDVETVKKAFDAAVEKSPALKAKVKDAGGKFDNKLIVLVRRDDSAVFKASRTRGAGVINVDLGDYDRLPAHLTSVKTDPAKAQADKDAVAKAILVFDLAHELDHARDGTETDRTKQKHNDPLNAPKAGKSTLPGPPDQNANDVMKDLATGVKRISYLTRSADDKQTTVDFTVNGQLVKLNVTGLEADDSKHQKSVPATEFGIDPAVIEGIPNEPCTTPDGVTCYPRSCGTDTADQDCDGVPDAEDNCPRLSNPQQADNNGNGIGQGCDPGEPFLVCDVDLNGVVDRNDIAAILAARDTPAGPSDPRDPNGDKRIDVNDARRCVLQCDNAMCVP